MVWLHACCSCRRLVAITLCRCERVVVQIAMSSLCEASNVANMLCSTHVVPVVRMQCRVVARDHLHAGPGEHP